MPGFDLFGGKSREPAGCEIRVGVAQLEITDLYPFLTAVEVESSRHEAWTATLTFESRRDEKGLWVVQDSGVFSLWDPITISASFGDRTEEVMRGYVREISAGYPEEPGSATVRIECQDASLALDREHVRKTWGGKDGPTGDALMFQDIVVSRHGLIPDPESKPGLANLPVVYQDDTDIHFLRKRAEANGYELTFGSGKVYFGPLRLKGKPQPTILVYAGPDTNCLSFDVTADAHQPEKVAVQRATETGKESEETVVEPDLDLLGPEPAAGGGPGLKDFVWRVRRMPGDPSELEARAKGKANELSMRIKAKGELDGTLYGHVLRVGATVPVDGVGERLSGIYYVDTVIHRFSEEGYRQTFQLLRNAFGDNVPAEAPGSLAASFSLGVSFSLGS